MPQEPVRSGEDTLTLDSDLAELDRLQEFLDAYCDRTGLPDNTRYHLILVLEELLINSVRHGRCDPRAQAIRIGLQREGDRLLIAFSDNGVPFDPSTAPPPNLTQDLLRRPIGGLGIHLVRSLVPEIRYERRDGRNCLFLAKPIETQVEPARPQEGTDADRDGNRSH